MLVTPYYAAIFGLFFVFISHRVIKARQKYKVAIGDGENEELSRAIRAHGNFAEYVPITLMLIYFAEMQTQSGAVAHVLGLTFLLARISHAYSISQLKEDLRFRVFGLATTGLVIGASALTILIAG